MNEHYKPKLPDVNLFQLITTWIIDTDLGKVYNSKGRELGCLEQIGYVRIFVRKRSLKRYQIIWWKATNHWPTSELDHINRVKNDDRFINLRICERHINTGNRNKLSGLPVGVVRHCTPGVKPYLARITINYRNIHLGYYNTPEEASNAYQERLSHELGGHKHG